MKKLLRSISLILVCLMICFTFCGCTALDEMRKAHAVWVDKEQTTILLNGKEYKLLPECEQFAPVADNSISVTESDVPLLLADMLGDYAWLSSDGNFIEVDTSYDDFVDKENEIKYYCISDRYNEINEMVHKRVDRGSTFFLSETGYLHKDVKTLMVVVSRRELVILEEEIAKIDPEAFVIVSEVKEVVGYGFTKRKVYR